VQAQDYPMALWSIAQRLSVKLAAVEAAVVDGSILRTHVLRPTWHFVPRDDLRWMQMLTGPRVLAQMRGQDRRNGLDAALIARAMKTMANAIERRGHLTRREIGAALSDARIATTPWLVGHYLMHAELRAIVCSGVPSGKQQTFALVDERAPRPSTLTRDEAIAELTERYFRSHGPATAKDYQWWSGLNAADAAKGIDMLGRRFERVKSGDRTYIVSAGRTSVRSKRGPAHFVQPFDEIVVAYTESRDAVDCARVAPADGGLLLRCVILDGQVVATWRMPPNRGPRSIVVEPLRRLTSVERAAVASAAARFERCYFASRGSH
jgi:hypothetical protein